MKKRIILGIIMIIISFYLGHKTTIETTRVDLIEEQETGMIIRIDSFGQWYNYYLEK